MSLEIKLYVLSQIKKILVDNYQKFSEKVLEKGIQNKILIFFNYDFK